MNYLGLLDLGSIDLHYTWTNCRHGATNIWKKLDRSIANASWLLLFPRAIVKNLTRTTSAHAPILIDTVGGNRVLAIPFQFEEFWMSVPGCRDVIQTTWEGCCTGSPTSKLYKNIQTTKVALKKWNKERVENLQNNIQRLMLELERVQVEDPTYQN